VEPPDRQQFRLAAALDLYVFRTYICAMDKNEIIARLQAHRGELQAMGAEHVSILGSVARGEATDESDLDVLVKLSEPVMQSGFGYFSTLEDLRARISQITGASHVDVVAEPVAKQRVRRNVEKDRAVAF
jgi:predicted nucleotidyltransferase